MFEPKIKLSKSAYDKVRVAAEILGCSIEDFVEKVLQAEAAKVISNTGKGALSQKEVDDIANSLKGLGYLE